MAICVTVMRIGEKISAIVVFSSMLMLLAEHLGHFPVESVNVGRASASNYDF